MKFACYLIALTVLISETNSLPAQDAVAELHAAIKPVPRGDAPDSWWMKRHQAMNDRVADGNVDLIFIGDSITQAWETAGKEVWKQHYGDRNAVNLGISGDRTQHVLWRLENGNIKGISPKLAVIMIGTNNSGRDQPKQTAQGVTRIVQKLRQELPETKVLLLAVFPRGARPDDAKRKDNDEVNEIISKLHDSEMVHYLDIADAFLDDEGRLSKEVMPDLLHLNAASYQKWADAIEPSVKQLMAN